MPADGGSNFAARDIIARADRLRRDRAPWESHWQQIRDFVFPIAAAVVGRETPGQMSHREVLDNSGETAHEMLAAALVSTLVPDTVDWFGLRAQDDFINDDRECAAWLEDSASRMMNVFRAPKGGFGTAQHEKYLDVTSFGTGGSFIARRPGRGIVFTSVPLQQLLIEEDSDGFVDGVMRDFTLTARQAYGRWQDQCGPKVRECAKSEAKADTRFRFLHSVAKRKERDTTAGTASNMPFASVYISAEDCHLITEGGFEEMPYQTPRWMKRAEEAYGRGPGTKALRELKGLQRTMRITIKGAEKQIDPPLMVADDGVLGPVRTSSGALNFYRSGTFNQDPIKPLITGGRADIGEEMMNGMRGRIDNAFLKPLIQMIRKDRMTATEVLRVTEEGQNILGPYLGRQKTEDLGPMIERVFSIMLREGGFRPMPQKMRGRVVNIEYVSPAVKSQRVARARGLAQFNEITAAMIQVNPALADNLDDDTAYRDTADIMGLPKTYLRAPDQVLAMRQARQEEARQKAQQQTLIEGGNTAANVIRAMPALQQSMGGGIAQAA